MKKYIDIHTHQKGNRENVFSLYNISPEDFIELPNNGKNYFSAGIHPWYIDSTVEEKIKILKQIASNPSIRAIGETGLDKRCPIDFDLQKKVFNSQIAIAKEVKKPLIIHCVKTYNEIQQVLKETQTNVPVIFHGFRGKPQLAKELTKAGFYLSFGNLFHEESLEKTPFERIFLETDDTDLGIEEIYRLVAEKRGVSIEKLIEITGENLGKCGCVVFA